MNKLQQDKLRDNIMVVRWGIIGCGEIARKRVARAIQQNGNCRLVAACRRNERELHNFCQEFHVERAYARYEDLLNDSEIDAVYIATPVWLHTRQTVAAAAASKHVLVEKPMARSAAECDLMINACRQQGVKLGVAYYRRFYPVVARIKELLACDALGQIKSISAITASTFGVGLQENDEGYWRLVHAKSGGGALMDIGSHRIDLFVDLCGPIAEVSAAAMTAGVNGDTEECATVVMQFETGIHGVVQCYFGTQAKADELRLIGSHGQLVSDPLNDGGLVVKVGNQTRTESHPPADNLHAPLISDFVAAIREDRSPRISGEVGRLTNLIIDQAYRFAQA